MKKSFFLILILIFFAVILSFNKPVSKAGPKIYLWAWERAENFSFLPTDGSVGVAYYAGAVTIENGEIKTIPRLQPIFIASSTPTIAVIRIDNFDAGSDLKKFVPEISNFILSRCSKKSEDCQVDFDARLSERDPYKILLSTLRRHLPGDKSLSITALVSWCDKTTWLDKTPIDYAVPMFYRIGPGKDLIYDGKVGQSFMKASKCQNDIGISLDERLPIAKDLESKNVYIFNPDSWTTEEFSRIIKTIDTTSS